MTADQHRMCEAFLFGWRDAYACGEDNNPYTDERRHFYRAGYDRGLADYDHEEADGTTEDHRHNEFSRAERMRDEMAGDVYRDMAADSSNEDL